MKTLVLGLGNDLYGDDGVGLHVIRWIEEQRKAGEAFFAEKNDVHFEGCSLSGLSLLDVITGYERLVLIDTLKKRDPTPGKIHILSEKDLRHIPGPSPHYVSVPQTIEIGKNIGLKVPNRITIIAVEAKNMYRLGEGLTPEMKKAIPEIIQTLKKLLQSEA
ncbi:MAG: hydrogenase maturation protease [Candidatus Aminicenantales bacterium]